MVQPSRFQTAPIAACAPARSRLRGFCAQHAFKAVLHAGHHEALAVLERGHDREIGALVLGHQLLQMRLAGNQRQGSQVLAVQLHDVEGDEGGIGGPLLAHQAIEVDAVAAHQDHLAVQGHAPAGQLSHRVRDAGEPLRQITAVAGVNGDVGADLHSLDAPAVELGFMRPGFTRGETRTRAACGGLGGVRQLARRNILGAGSLEKLPR